MKYIISYECRTGGKVFNGTIEIESESLPLNHDNEVLEIVRKDSLQFYKSGQAGIQVSAIAPKD